MGHMTKMATTTTNFLLQNKKPVTLKPGIKHTWSQHILFNDDLWLTLTYYTTRSNLLSYANKRGGVFVSYIGKNTMDFLFTSNFCTSAPALGLYTNK